MPATVAAPVCLSDVYAAFDAAGLRAFRAAMARSRGGVVRVADLLGALAERLPAAAARIPLLLRPPPTGPCRVPLANEPALRQWLMAAYLRAVATGRPLDDMVLLEAAPIPPVLPPPPRLRASSAPPRPSEAEQIDALLRHWVLLQQAPAGEPYRRARERLQELAQIFS